MNPEGKIYLNGRFLRQRLTGVQRYAKEISTRQENQLEVLIPPKKFGTIWEQIYLPTRIHRKDLLWSPTNTGPVITRNQVVTIHDISPIDHPEWFNHQFAAWYQFLIPQLIHRTRKIITDSLFSRNRIIERFNIPDSRVVAIPLGVGESFHPCSKEAISSTLNKYKITSPYILAVGSIEPRKNLRRLFQAWTILMPKFSNYRLIVAGSTGYPFQDPELGELPPYIQLLGIVDDLDLPAIYCGASLFAYPSIYEGFGLPVLEAMACATPVIASNAASIPEAVGEAGLLFNPFDIEDIAGCIEKVLSDDQVYNTLSRLGLFRAKQMTWQSTSQRVIEVLQEELLNQE